MNDKELDDIARRQAKRLADSIDEKVANAIINGDIKLNIVKPEECIGCITGKISCDICEKIGIDPVTKQPLDI